MPRSGLARAASIAARFDARDGGGDRPVLVVVALEGGGVMWGSEPPDGRVRGLTHRLVKSVARDEEP